MNKGLVTAVAVLSLAVVNSVTSSSPADTVVFFDDFEGYEVGTYPSEVWTEMYSGVSAVISSEKYYSPEKSFKLTGRSNWARSDYIHVEYFDRFYYEAGIYVIDETAGVGFSVQKGSIDPTFNFLRFDKDGFIYFTEKDKWRKIQQFSHNKWYTVRVYIDYSNLKATVCINGERIAENIEIYPYSFHHDLCGDVTLDRFTLHIPNFEYGAASAYFDDVAIVALPSAGELCPLPESTVDLAETMIPLTSLYGRVLFSAILWNVLE